MIVGWLRILCYHELFQIPISMVAIMIDARGLKFLGQELVVILAGGSGEDRAIISKDIDECGALLEKVPVAERTLATMLTVMRQGPASFGLGRLRGQGGEALAELLPAWLFGAGAAPMDAAELISAVLSSGIEPGTLKRLLHRYADHIVDRTIMDRFVAVGRS